MRRAVPFKLEEARLSYQLLPGRGREATVLVVLVRRMLFEIVANLDFPREVNLDQVFFFTPPEDEGRGQKFSDDLTLGDILPKALHPEAARHMMEALAPYKGHLSTGIQSTHRLLLELTRNGYH